LNIPIIYLIAVKKFPKLSTSNLKRATYGIVLVTHTVLLACVSHAQSTPPVLWTYGPINEGFCQAFSRDGSKLYVAGEQGVQIFNSSTHLVLGCLPTIYPVIEALTLSPDGTTLALGGNLLTGGPGVVELWSLTSSKRIRTISTVASNIVALTFSQDGKSLAVGGQPSTSPAYPIQIFDVATGELKLSPKVAASTINSLEFSKDGASLAVGGSTGASVAEIISTSTGLPLQTFKTSSTVVNSVAFSADGKSLVIGGFTPDLTTLSETGYLEVWDASTGLLNATLSTACQSVNSLQFSPDGKSLVVGVNPMVTNDGAIQLWNTSTWQEKNVFNKFALNGVSSVAFSPNGKTIAEMEGLNAPIHGNSRTAVNLWDASSYALNGSLNLSIYGATSSSTFSPDGKTLLSGSGGLNPTGSAEIYYGLLQYSDALTGNLVKTVKTPNYFGSITISPNGKLLAACGQNMTNSTLELRDPVSGKLITTLNTLENDQYYLVTFSRDGSLIAASRSVTSNTVAVQNVEIWNVAKHMLIETLDTAMSAQVGGMSFSADGSVLAVGGTGYSGQTFVGEMQLWNISKGTLTTPLYPAIYFINAVQYSPDGTQLAIGGITYDATSAVANGSVEIWNTVSESRDLLLKLPSGSTAVTALAYSRDGNVIHAGSKIGVESFDTSNGMILEDDGIGSVNCISVSPDGTLISYSSYLPLLGVLQSPVTSIKLSSATILGGHATTGTVTIPNPAPDGGVSVSLFSNITAATFPSTVTVAPGKTSTTFSLSTVPVSIQQVAAISAFVGGYSQTASLTIQGPTLTAFKLTPAAVKGGLASSGTVSINIPAPTGGIVISVSSSSSSAVVPDTVTIPAGKTTAKFSIGTGSVKSKTQVGISIRLGSSTQTKLLTIS
jgi:WD40 repeat protein